MNCTRLLLVASLAAAISSRLFAVPAATPLTTPPGPVTDPDGKQPARYSLPAIELARGGTISVTKGDAYYEQAIIVWRVDSHASAVQVGQLNRGSNAMGRPRGDGGGRSQSLALKTGGTYYFQCWHKIEKPNKNITEVGWTASYERLTGDNQSGYTLSCDDGNAQGPPSGDADYDDIVAEIRATK
jgi:hypothetical protein